MFNLIIILLSTLNGEPKGSNNYKIAKFMIENIHDLEDYTLTELAKACYVSNSSISRFCRDIGLRDFNQLKNQVAKFSVEKIKFSNKFNYEGRNEDSIFTSYVSSVIENLEMLEKSSIEDDIKDLVDDIYEYQKVAAFGYMHSENVALNLQYDLRTSAKPVFTAIKVADQAEYITNADEKTLIILFSDSGTYFDRIFPRAKPFKHQSKKPKICLITSNKELDYPFIDQYIRYDSRGDYATHPYSLTAIADTICIEYAKMLKELE